MRLKDTVIRGEPKMGSMKLVLEYDTEDLLFITGDHEGFTHIWFRIDKGYNKRIGRYSGYLVVAISRIRLEQILTYSIDLYKIFGQPELGEVWHIFDAETHRDVNCELPSAIFRTLDAANKVFVTIMEPYHYKGNK